MAAETFGRFSLPTSQIVSNIYIMILSFEQDCPPYYFVHGCCCSERERNISSKEKKRLMRGSLGDLAFVLTNFLPANG